MPKGNGDILSSSSKANIGQVGRERGKCRKAMEIPLCSTVVLLPDIVGNGVNAERQWRLGICGPFRCSSKYPVGNGVNAERQWRLPFRPPLDQFVPGQVGNGVNAERQWRRIFNTAKLYNRFEVGNGVNAERQISFLTAN